MLLIYQYYSRMATNDSHGGKRRNAGRKTEIVGAKCRQRTVSIDEMTERRLMVLGGGNFSKGIRIAAAAAFDLYQSDKLKID